MCLYHFLKFFNLCSNILRRVNKSHSRGADDELSMRAGAWCQWKKWTVHIFKLTSRTCNSFDNRYFSSHVIWRRDLKMRIKDLHETTTHVCPITYIFHVQRSRAGRSVEPLHIICIYTAARTPAQKAIKRRDGFWNFFWFSTEDEPLCDTVLSYTSCGAQRRHLYFSSILHFTAHTQPTLQKSQRRFCQN